MKFHHVGVHVSDFAKSRPMYEAIMDALGFENYDVPGHICTAWGTAKSSFRIVQPPIETIRASTSHICFEAPSEKSVEHFFADGESGGFEGLSAPNEYVDGGFRHYTTMLRDPDGNCIEAVFVDPVPSSPEEVARIEASYAT